MKQTEQDRYGAVEKCRAVLAVWTERKKPSDLCRELGVSASVLSQWQDRALSGMLEALEPRGAKANLEQAALPAQIRRLLDRKVRSQELVALGRHAPWMAPEKNRLRRKSKTPTASS